MKNTTLVLLILLFSSSALYSSRTYSQLEIKKTYGDAEYFYLYGEYDKALNSYENILQSDPSNANIHYKIGLCFLQFQEEGYYKKALYHFSESVKNVSTDYKNTYKETAAPLIVWMYYGDVLRLNYNFEEAIKAYDTYINLNPNDKLNKAYIERERQNCKEAPALIEHKIYLNDFKINPNIEKKQAFESCPVISDDENIMVFSYGRENILPPDLLSVKNTDDYILDDIYFTTKENGIWKNSVNITNELGTNGKAMPVSISADGKTLFLVQDDNDDGNIYQSHFENGQWSKMKKLNSNINTRQWETHACITSDGKTLYFASDRKGGYGGFDIYKSDLDEKGEWGKAENLGPSINTKYDEDTPNITHKGNELYFSSQGHKSLGGFDIFMSALNQGDWSEAENVGFPLNTPGNDLFYLTQYEGQLAFAPLNDDKLRATKIIDESNLFIVSSEKPVITVNTYVLLSDLNQMPKDIVVDTTSVHIKNLSIVDNLISFESEVQQFDLRISAKGTDTTSVNIHLTSSYESYTKTYHAELHPLVSLDNNELLANNKSSENPTIEGEPTAKPFKEIYFGFDKSTVQSQFMTEVETIYKAWLADSSQTVQIEGYADPVGPEAYNMKLSQYRADAVKEALLHLGMTEDKIRAVGRGETNENANNYYNRKTVISFTK